MLDVNLQPYADFPPELRRAVRARRMRRYYRRRASNLTRVWAFGLVVFLVAFLVGKALDGAIAWWLQ